MIDLYFWTTPNGYKPLIFLEESGLPHRVRPVDIGAGEQFAPHFLEISPNSRIPAMIDHDPDGATAPLSLFESGAILLYLAEKTGRFLPREAAGRADALQWLFWQMGGLGPMLGQNLHFSAYAPVKLDYAIARYENETRRLYGVLDRRLAARDFVAGAYSIADMAIYPWVLRMERERPYLSGYLNVARWHEAISARPAVARAYAKGRAINTTPTVNAASKSILFNQTAAHAAA